MKQVTRVYEEEHTYTEYEVGDIVLVDGIERKVVKFSHPLFAHEDPIVFCEGEKYGLTTEYVKFVRSAA